MGNFIKTFPSGIRADIMSSLSTSLFEKEGNLKFFKVNKNPSLFPELKGLIAESLYKIKRSVINVIKKTISLLLF
jgi:hypothetical protein